MDLVPLFRAERIALKGKLHTTQRALEKGDLERVSVAKLSSQIEAANRQISALQLQLDFMRKDLHRQSSIRKDFETPILQLTVNEARDEHQDGKGGIAEDEVREISAGLLHPACSTRRAAHTCIV